MSTLSHARPWTLSAFLPGRRLARLAVDYRLRRITGGKITWVDGNVSIYGDGALAVTVRIHDERAYEAVAWGGSVGAGEAFAAGWWSVDDLVGLVRLLARDPAGAASLERGLARIAAPLRRLGHVLRPNTRAGARQNIAAHYDLSNDFYKLWLDPTLSYSACIFAQGDTLEAAAVRKLDAIGDRLGLRAGHHLVEIGTGWGGLAIHLARRHGCRVTTTTISAAQAHEARQRVHAAGLADRIRVLESDYRDLPAIIGAGAADRVVSVEMIEAIGHRQYPTFYRTIAELLRPDGAALVQAILMPERRYAAARDEVDYIKAHIFPGCCIPAAIPLMQAMRHASDLDLVASHDLTADYARTLAAWRQRFLARADAVTALGFDQHFQRAWEFYLAYCEGGFAERAILDVQHVYARPGWRG
jgi:cyclopropane-fatty-acyl-phospholipid synthase